MLAYDVGLAIAAGAIYNLAGMSPGAVRPENLQSPPRTTSLTFADASAHSSSACTTTQEGLGALSASLRHITSSCWPSSERPDRGAPNSSTDKAGFYVSISAATASLFSTSPELKPLAVPMSPFMTKNPRQTWEDAMSQLTVSNRKDAMSTMKKTNSAHRDPRHSLPAFGTWEDHKSKFSPRKARMSASHLTWEDAMSGYRCLYVRLLVLHISLCAPAVARRQRVLVCPPLLSLFRCLFWLFYTSIIPPLPCHSVGLRTTTRQ
jgi:hypothetical protein